MGYIIPISPIQSQIYANRMLMDNYNFAYINNVDSVKMKSSFEDHLEEQILENNREKQVLEPKEQMDVPLYKSFIQPNPINLSPIIAEISGKGNILNRYIWWKCRYICRHFLFLFSINRSFKNKKEKICRKAWTIIQN